MSEAERYPIGTRVEVEWTPAGHNRRGTVIRMDDLNGWRLFRTIRLDSGEIAGLGFTYLRELSPLEQLAEAAE